MLCQNLINTSSSQLLISKYFDITHMLTYMFLNKLIFIVTCDFANMSILHNHYLLTDDEFEYKFYDDQMQGDSDGMKFLLWDLM